MSDYMTSKEVAELTRTAPETIRYWRHVKKGPKFFKANGRVLYRRDDVQAWLDEQYDKAGQ